MGAATYRAEEVAKLLGISEWALYQSVRRGDCPVAPIKVGRRLVWPRSPVRSLLGLAAEEHPEPAAR